MWSINSARTAGARIARSADPSLSNRELIRLIDSELLHEFQPRKSAARKRAEEVGAALSLSVMGGIAAVAALICLYAPKAWLDNPFAQSLSPIIDFVTERAGLTTVLSVLMLAILVAHVVLLNSSRRRADTAYRSEILRLRRAALEGAQGVLDRRQGRGVALRPQSHRTRSTPDPIRLNLTPRGAEELAAQWMRYLGEPHAQTTTYVGDGGIDVVGERLIAQVKHFEGRVGVAPIRELAGVAVHDGRQPLFFTQTGYAAGAITFADQAGVALFVYDAPRGELTAWNERARQLWERGLG